MQRSDTKFDRFAVQKVPGQVRRTNNDSWFLIRL